MRAVRDILSCRQKKKNKCFLCSKDNTVARGVLPVVAQPGVKKVSREVGGMQSHGRNDSDPHLVNITFITPGKVGEETIVGRSALLVSFRK